MCLLHNNSPLLYQFNFSTVLIYSTIKSSDTVTRYGLTKTIPTILYVNPFLFLNQLSLTFDSNNL